MLLIIFLTTTIFIIVFFFFSCYFYLSVTTLCLISIKDFENYICFSFPCNIMNFVPFNINTNNFTYLSKESLIKYSGNL